MKTPDLSIVIPCYNEAENLPLIFSRLRQVVKNRAKVEVILVNNGSSDNSSSVFDEERRTSSNSQTRLVDVPENKGYGFGIMAGVSAARGEVIAWTHADLQTDLKDVIDAFDVFRGQRCPAHTFLKGKRMNQKPFDTFFTFGMSLFCSFLLRQSMFDINAQPKIFHRQFLEHLEQVPNDFSLDLYAFYKAKSCGLDVVEFPVHFLQRRHGKAKGGGTFLGKLRLIRRTLSYVFRLKRQLGV